MKTFHGLRLPEGHIRLWATGAYLKEVAWVNLPGPSVRGFCAPDWGPGAANPAVLARALLREVGLKGDRFKALVPAYARQVVARLTAHEWAIRQGEVLAWVDSPRAVAAYRHFRDVRLALQRKYHARS